MTRFFRMVRACGRILPGPCELGFLEIVTPCGRIFPHDDRKAGQRDAIGGDRFVIAGPLLRSLDQTLGLKAD
jgi:hypothetical protein